MAEKTNFAPLIHLRTPTDFRRLNGLEMYSINWLLPDDPYVESEIRKAVEIITCDWTLLDFNDPYELSAYLESIKEPLDMVGSLGFGLFFERGFVKVTSGGTEPFPMSVIKITVVERPCVYINEDCQSAPKLHLFNACKVTSLLGEENGAPLAILRKGNCLATLFSDSTDWCETCWEAISPHRDELARIYVVPSLASYTNRAELAEVIEFVTLVQEGENQHIEFKGLALEKSFKSNRESAIHPRILKSIVGFLNSFGGTILVGVSDNGELNGLEPDCFKIRRGLDGLELKLRSILRDRVTPVPLQRIKCRIVPFNELRLWRIDVEADLESLTALDGDVYVREGNSTMKLPVDQIDQIRRFRDRNYP